MLTWQKCCGLLAVARAWRELIVRAQRDRDQPRVRVEVAEQAGERSGMLHEAFELRYHIEWQQIPAGEWHERELNVGIDLEILGEYRAGVRGATDPQTNGRCRRDERSVEDRK